MFALSGRIRDLSGLQQWKTPFQKVLGPRDTSQLELTTLAMCHSSSNTRNWHCLWLEWEEGFYKAGFLDGLSSFSALQVASSQLRLCLLPLLML